jgi:hypothetical protein
MIDISEFVEAYVDMCEENGEDWDNYDIALAWCEQNIGSDLTDEEFLIEVDILAKKLPYYTGRGEPKP